MICVDNKSVQALSKNPVYHDRSKHIDTRYHFIRECIAKKEVDLRLANYNVLQRGYNLRRKFYNLSEEVGGFVVEVGKFVSKCIYPKIENIVRFSSKIENLRKEMEKLTKFRDEIKEKVEGAEGEGYKRKPDVTKWIEDVQKLDNEWEVMQESIAAAKMLAYKCCPKCSLRSEVSTQAKYIRDQQCRLIKVGENFGSNLVVENYRMKKVELIPGPSIEGQSTAARNLHKILQLLEDDKLPLLG
ncbi:hypothetical protein FXO38_23282 [Capsicum annuum]|nr:hypothetical protein FXO38_23282 [Capsicum annuum]KAF3641459.1 hypothetical protein FXO37_22978 [Capsicum annuum]